MNKYFLNFTKLFGVACLTTFMVDAYAQNPIVCPVLTAADVKTVIAEGSIATDPNYTLANEAGEAPAQVIANEPTANPYDTFYSMSSVKYKNNLPYYIYVGNILGKDNNEARSRAEKIILTGEEVFIGSPYMNANTCIYKAIDASPSIPSYPFKSKYESVVLVAISANTLPNPMWKNMRVIK